MATRLLNRYLGGGGGGGGGTSPEGLGVSRGGGLAAAKGEVEVIIMKAVIMGAERESKLSMSKSLSTVREREMDRTCN